MKLAIDIDGVVAATEQEMIATAKNRGMKLVFDQHHPLLDGVLCPDEIILGIVHFTLTHRTQFIKPYKEALEFLPLMSKEIGPITFITARSDQYFDSTREWLDTHFKFSYTLISKESHDKPQFVLTEGFDAFIEDRLSTANAAAEIGINTYLIDRQWNRGRALHKNVKKVSSVGDVYTDLCYTVGRLNKGEENGPEGCIS